ncbi:PREDICTED: uncharacterized protein LOC104803404 isoform X1 [Tarenaya hassleriana]|uniref:uncharacterized protein LOC104803404 isoform X1 n=1 Tax=Tarenaya hassleriana TaxID=28532 RepID=UPI0008FCF7B1|nr:PREDICTED: uncharacterized protein LOC104803404 isoform X1 [Tarenaya hassleriana]XP_019056838.1 PREDICTED: uncharacterized protein LOC104803404 isoform X1 [Tarenaya hassleriana]XP_019056839.1 PREDICTED: uncharacterized protein LOC104803404 isoform X1 [Tarenaya hassleriana]XP_019056840.1 PREDICTED: uncharacterized protein LOC104803404 isoform X1 [Tarenaya hassleriana]XP_019056841.1 PREDICTED: uncharacterized protein LOC104803404 isoform X1 [Tarenaya hassleriana]XP_019056842.1 PREDICTED: unch
MPPRLRSSTIPYSSRFAESQPPSSAGVGTALTGRFAAPLPSTGGVLTDPSSSVNPPLLSPDISGQAPGMPQSPVSGEDSGPPPVTQVTGVSLLASGPSTALIPLSASSPSASLTQREQNLTPASFADVAPPVTTGVSLPTSGLPAVPILSPVSFPSASAASIADAALPVTHQTGGPPAAQVLASSRRTLETTAPQADQTAPPQKSWSSMVRDSIRKLKRIGTPSTHPSGAPLVHISQESLVAAKTEWADFVIGQFYGHPPSMGKIIGVVNSVWVRPGQRIRVHDMGNGCFLFRVPNMTVKETILGRTFWHIGSCPMIVSEWDPDHDPDKPPIRSIQTWVKLRNVPLKLFDEDSLSRIATTIGDPLYLDKATEGKLNFSVARIFMEVNLQQTLPRTVVVKLPSDTEVTIGVSYSWLPPTCSICSEIGHKSNRCPRNLLRGPKPGQRRLA